MGRLSCLVELLLVLAIIGCVVERYAPPVQAFPSGLTWYYNGGVADFGVMVAPSVNNHWYYVHCEIKNYWIGMRPGAEYRFDEGSNYFEPVEEGLSACEFMRERYRVRQFLPLVIRDVK